jgi:hypothetical protein
MNEEAESWVIEELGGTELGDKRRTARLIQLVNALGARPGASLPQAMENQAKLKAAYRFFDNEAIESGAILEEHLATTYRRIGQTSLVLAVQDTTYLDWTHHPHTVGLGPLASENRQGLLVHSTLAMTAERVPLGVLQQQVWARDPETYAQLEDRKQRKIGEKESQKWLTSLSSVIAASQANPETHFVSVGDREADVYDLFEMERGEKVDLLVRAIRNRRVEQPERYLWATMAVESVAINVELQVPRQKNRPVRLATLQVRWKKVHMRPPQHRSAEKLPILTVWVVWAVEANPPADTDPIEWMLLSTKPVLSNQDAVERLDWYACRWGIEVWHKILKSGCRIEARQLDHADRLKRLLTLFSVVAWRILYATMLARAVPDLTCTVFFEEEEWQALYCAVHRTTLLPEKTPALREAVRMVAQLGGFLGRKQDGEPGVSALWKGFQRLPDFLLMYRLFHSPGDQDVGKD